MTDTITLPREVVQKALDALQYMTMTAEHCVDNEIPESAIAALRTALAAEWGAKQEREACAKVCEALGNDASIDDLAYEAFREADEAIRARGEGKP